MRQGFHVWWQGRWNVFSYFVAETCGATRLARLARMCSLTIVCVLLLCGRDVW